MENKMTDFTPLRPLRVPSSLFRVATQLGMSQESLVEHIVNDLMEHYDKRGLTRSARILLYIYSIVSKPPYNMSTRKVIRKYHLKRHELDHILKDSQFIIYKEGKKHLITFKDALPDTLRDNIISPTSHSEPRLSDIL